MAQQLRRPVSCPRPVAERLDLNPSSAPDCSLLLTLALASVRSSGPCPTCGAAGPQPWPGPALIGAEICGVKQWMKDVSLPTSLSSKLTTN